MCSQLYMEINITDTPKKTVYSLVPPTSPMPPTPLRSFLFFSPPWQLIKNVSFARRSKGNNIVSRPAVDEKASTLRIHALNAFPRPFVPISNMNL